MVRKVAYRKKFLTKMSTIYSPSSFSGSVRSLSSVTTADSTDVTPKRMADFYRNLWWNSGEFSSKANWEEVTLPYKLAVSTLEDYEQRIDKFNIRGCLEWVNGDVIIYEFPSEPHEIVIGAVTRILFHECNDVFFTNAEIYSLGSTRTCDRNSVKEADNSFRPKKPAVNYPNGSNGNDRPWPNLVVEVAYFESIEHITDRVRDYWLIPDRVHDAIIIKIDPAPQGQVPTCMRAWHYCVSGRGRGMRNSLPVKKMVMLDYIEFGTHDANGNQLNIQQGQCIIEISLSCLYHDLKPPIQIPQNLPNPIPLNFTFVRDAIINVYDI